VPGRVLKLPQRPFEVGEWIYVVGVFCAPIDHGFELLFGFAGELRYYLEAMATDLQNPNFAKLAEAAGLLGLRAETP